jgi:hypothetical protein
METGIKVKTMKDMKKGKKLFDWALLVVGVLMFCALPVIFVVFDGLFYQTPLGDALRTSALCVYVLVSYFATVLGALRVLNLP